MALEIIDGLLVSAGKGYVITWQTDCPSDYWLTVQAPRLLNVFQLRMNVEIVKLNGNFRFKTQKLVIYPAIVGILTFIRRIMFSLS